MDEMHCTEQVAPLPPPRVVSVPVAAELLGGISERQLWYLIARGELAAMKIGRRTMIEVVEIDGFLDRARARGGRASA